MEPEAYAKLATRGDVLPPFYITDAHVKYRDQTGVPTQIEILLGRSPPPQVPGQLPVGVESYNADYHIGNRMKIRYNDFWMNSKKHAKIYWSEDQGCFCIKSICKNAVKVNGTSYSGSPDLMSGMEARLASQDCIEIADSAQIYFLLPKAKHATLQKPRQTYEQLVNQVMDRHEKLTLDEIITRIKDRHPFFASEGGEKLETSLRTTLLQKKKSFIKVVDVDSTGKKVQYYQRNLEEVLVASTPCASTPSLPPPASFAPLPATAGVDGSAAFQNISSMPTSGSGMVAVGGAGEVRQEGATVIHVVDVG